MPCAPGPAPGPLPVPVFTPTVRIAPVPVTLVIEAPVIPGAVRLKSAAVTPITFSENVTLKNTVVRVVGFEFKRTLETTLGPVLSTV